ncbi:EPOXIDE HYDROLASE [Salix koriyanagi]|uniref:EPOXIDE HYDROLASE n=1 Tax=Salix koriyanagi TaxID=2511006 RepID=A0A9Q0ZKP1_9ROSI|nr:EPOXIDE HYDROLASE [Salix koriyanagi]
MITGLLGRKRFWPLRYKDLPEGFYIHRWKEPGRAEADFSRFDVKTVWRNIYILFSRNEIPIADKDKEIMDLVDPSTPLPSWLSSEDLAIYAEAYEKSGFDSPMRAPYKGLHREFTIRNPSGESPSAANYRSRPCQKDHISFKSNSLTR